MAHITKILVAALAFGLAGLSGTQGQTNGERVNRAELVEGGFNLGLFADGERDGFMRYGWYSDEEGVHLWDGSMIVSRSDYESFSAPADLEGAN